MKFIIEKCKKCGGYCLNNKCGNCLEYKINCAVEEINRLDDKPIFISKILKLLKPE